MQLVIAGSPSVEDAKINSITFTTLFDAIQLMHVDSCETSEESPKLTVTFHFHWVGRYADKLKQDAVREANRRAK